MRVCIFTEPHRGATYDDELRFVRRVEDCGFEGYLRADHYESMGVDAGLPGPTDAWLTLAALARETRRIRLGTLVSSATFRLPGPLAIMVAQVDHMSGGRVEFGLGAGWFAREHTSYGIPFPPISERFDRLAEQLDIISGLWATPVDERYTYRGEHYELVNAPALPKPVQRPGPPIIIGGNGPKRTPELAVRYGDEFNLPFKSVVQTRRGYERVAEAAERLGRAAAGRPPLLMSAGVVVACGRTDADAQRRAAPLHAKTALPPEDPVVGPPSMLVDRIGELAAIGTGRVHLRLIDMADFDHLELIAAEVLPHVG
jgi:F420-dependent oxidoreductase-like protein